jgi:hypothetical protein
MPDLVARALELLHEYPFLAEDARKHAPTGATALGDVLQGEYPNATRWEIQAAAVEALAMLEGKE